VANRFLRLLPLITELHVSDKSPETVSGDPIRLQILLHLSFLETTFVIRTDAAVYVYVFTLPSAKQALLRVVCNDWSRASGEAGDGLAGRLK
jgi:hypothetical protein